MDTQKSEDEISLQEIASIIWNRFYLIVIVLAITVIGAFLYLQTTVNQYMSSAVLLVEPIKESSTLGKVISSSFFDSDNDIITEIELISNITNLNSAIKKLDLTKYKNSKGELYSSPSVLGSLKDKISVSNNDGTNIVELKVSDENPQFCADYANAIAESFNEMLSTYSKDERVSQLNFLDTQIPSTEEKLKIANNKLFSYKAKTEIDLLLNSVDSFVNHITYLRLRKKPLELQIEKSDLAISEFQKAYKLQLPSLDYYRNDKEINEILTTYERSFDELILFDMISNNDYRNTTSLSVVNYNINSSVNERVNQLNLKMDRAKKMLYSRISIIVSDNGIDSRGCENSYYDINSYYHSIVNILCSQVDVKNIEKNILNFEEELNKIPIIYKQLSQLESDVDSLENIRKELNSIHEQLSLTIFAENNNVKLVSPAIVPIVPSSPNRLLIIAVSVLLGLAFGVMLCIVLNILDDKIHDIETVEKIVGPKIPILGWVPFIKKKDETNSSVNELVKYPNSYISERYKAITSNILYGSNKENKIFTVTSSNINEGKSSLVCNVCLCLSKLGYKVLIIDGDVRSPSLANVFGLDNEVKGYIHAIEECLPVSSACLAPIKDNLNVNILLPGKSKLNASVFYAHTNYQKSLEQLKTKYDYIFIDSPPLEYATELLGLLEYVDSILLCARMSVVEKKQIGRLIKHLERYQNLIGGVILTACPLSKVPSYSKYKGYKYNYLNGKIDDNCNITYVNSERIAKKIYKEELLKRLKVKKKK